MAKLLMLEVIFGDKPSFPNLVFSDEYSDESLTSQIRILGHVALDELALQAF